MNVPQGDPTYIKNKEKYFIEIAKTVALASTHPKSPGGCILVRDREIIGDGRSILSASKVEIDCLTYAIATCSKRGTPTTGAVVYTTRYPFSASIFQCYLMGIKKIVILAHEWEPYYRDEFRRAARLARELGISIEPFYDKADQRFTTNEEAPVFDETEDFDKKDLYTTNPVEDDSFDIEEHSAETYDPNIIVRH